jgi:uncharacterized membrane protein
MLEVLAHWFAAICGQDPGHTWAPGGILLPCCQRCTGLYVGAGAAALLHLWLRPKLSGRFLEIHGVFLVVMVPFGFHWVAQGPVLRTLTGVLFGFGVVTLLWLPLSQRADSRGRSRRRQSAHFSAVNEISADCRACCPSSPVVGRVSPSAPRGAETVLNVRLWATADGALGETRPAFKWTVYFLILGATLIALPTTAMLGGACAAYGLSGAACWGALVLAALIAGDVSLGLLGALRLLRRLTRARLQP